jgi:hypothetical protein
MKLFRLMTVAGAMSALLIGAAFAGSMEARYGNTVVATASNGTTTKVYYNADNTLTASITPKDGAATEAKGSWRLDGATICITADTAFGPFAAGAETCIPLQGDKVGDNWETKAKDAQGVEVVTKVTIVAGR